MKKVEQIKRFLFIFYLIIPNLCFSNIIDTIPKGEIIDKICCLSDKKISYALYLPSDYNKNKKYQVLICFDPAARGSLIVKKYKDIAEKESFILLCSNNSKNRQGTLNKKFANVLISELKTRFSVDENRIYTMGFSGGARVAIGAAVRTNKIAGTIACGAGFPGNYKPNQKYDFSIVGVIGIKDPNYLEMKFLKEKMEGLNSVYHDITYEGDHNWPHSEYITEAMICLKLDAMRNNTINKDQIFINNLIKNFEERILKNNTDKFKLYILYEKFIKKIKGLANISLYEKKIKMLSESIYIKNRIKNENNNKNIEIKFRSRFSNALLYINTYDLYWWKTEAASLKKTNNNDYNLIIERVKAFINLYCYESFNYRIRNEEYNFAEKYLNIYSIIEPNNYLPYYLYAKLFAFQKNKSGVLKMLKKSIKKGFSDFDYLKKDKTFDFIKDNKKFKEITADNEHSN